MATSNPFAETNPYETPVLAGLAPVPVQTVKRRAFPYVWMLVAAASIYAVGTDNYTMWMCHPFPFLTMCIVGVSVPLFVVKFVKWLFSVA